MRTASSSPGQALLVKTGVFMHPITRLTPSKKVLSGSQPSKPQAIAKGGGLHALRATCNESMTEAACLAPAHRTGFMCVTPESPDEAESMRKDSSMAHTFTMSPSRQQRTR
eukprot:2446475-Amphidinium_carterae.1